MPINFQTYFVSSIFEEKEGEILRTVPFSSYIPILLFLCRQFLKTVVYILSRFPSHFSQIHSNLDIAPAAT